MSLVRKLKPDRNITGLFVPLAVLAIFGLSIFVIDLRGAYWVLAAIFFVYALYSTFVFTRTRNIPYLVSGLYQLFAGAWMLSLSKYLGSSMNTFADNELGAFFVFIFFIALLVYFVATRKIKWRGREIFELAAESVEDSGNGYTSRPRPVGKLVYSPQQLREFSRFLARNLVALPYATSGNVTLVPIKMGDEFGRLLGFSGDFRDATWVNFADDGNVSVHIAQKDYLDYREALAFDQLCTSLGQLFIDFFELFNKGEGIRVIDRMDDLKISVFS